MNFIPTTLSSAQLNVKLNTRRYVCPLCDSSHAQEEIVEWVYTPVSSFPICTGCCYDLYSLSKSETFESNPYKTLFVELAELENTSVIELRKIALENQLYLVQQAIEQEEDNFYVEQYMEEKHIIVARLNERE